MANHKSALKRARQTIVRNMRNTALKSYTRTLVKKVEAAVSEKKIDEAKEMFRMAQKSLAKIGQKGVVHRNTAARKISRLNQLVNTLLTSK